MSNICQKFGKHLASDGVAQYEKTTGIKRLEIRAFVLRMGPGITTLCELSPLSNPRQA